MIRTSWSEPREQYSNTVAVRIGSANQPIVNKRKAKMNGDAKMRMTWEMSIRHKKFRPISNETSNFLFITRPSKSKSEIKSNSRFLCAREKVKAPANRAENCLFPIYLILDFGLMWCMASGYWISYDVAFPSYICSFNMLYEQKEQLNIRKQYKCELMISQTEKNHFFTDQGIYIFVTQTMCHNQLVHCFGFQFVRCTRWKFLQLH